MDSHTKRLGSSPRDDQPQRRVLELAAQGQAVFYVLTGIWALVDITSFQKVTGPKTDLWLVKTVGALVIAVGAPIGLAARKRRLTPELGVLAVGSAASLATIDLVYVAKKRISPVYLLDAVAELGLIALWAAGWKSLDRDRPA
jgi:hypothetical protein